MGKKCPNPACGEPVDEDDDVRMCCGRPLKGGAGGGLCSAIARADVWRTAWQGVQGAPAIKNTGI